MAECASHEWAIASDVAEIDGIVAQVVAYSRAAGFDARQCRLNIPVALTEALSNAILCGNNSDSSRYVRVSMQLNGQELVLCVSDEGDGFDHTRNCNGPGDPDWLEREDGRGLFLMRSLMDEVQYMAAPPPRRGHTVRLLLRRA